jgi:hypothetical protein
MPASYPADLARHVRAQLQSRIENPPSLEVLKKLFEAMYFASLKSEEAEPISCRIAFVDRNSPDPSPPERKVANRWKYFRLDRGVRLSVRNLVKLSKAVDPWGSTLAVDADQEGKLWIWGLIDQSVHYSTYLVKEASSGPEMPGIFQALIQGIGELAVYRTYLLLGSLTQDLLITKQQIVFQTGPIHSKIVPSVQQFREKVKQTVGREAYKSRPHWDATLEDLWISAVCRILIGIQRYGHGGAVLISDLPDGLKPKYSLSYDRLATSLRRVATRSIENTSASDQIHEEYVRRHEELLPMELHLRESASNEELRDANEEVTGCVRFLASLSRVDGLIWLDGDLCLHGFGVEITAKRDPTTLLLAQDSQGRNTRTLRLTHYGMRHRSMMRHCAAHPESLGFVVSQDGDVRAITSVDDSVLVWENVRIQSIRNARPVTTD